MSGVRWGSVTHCPCAGRSPGPPEGPATSCGLYSSQKAELMWPGPGPRPKPCHCMAWGPKPAGAASRQVLQGLASAWGAGGKGPPRASWFFVAHLPLTPLFPPEAPRRSQLTTPRGSSMLWATAWGSASSPPPPRDSGPDLPSVCPGRRPAWMVLVSLSCHTTLLRGWR